jgi:uncharacterized protein YdbL (DUF1318 family)
MKRMKTMVSLAIAMVIGVACLAQADDMSDARERRKARRAQVEQLVQSGSVTEGSDGYLAAKGALDAAKAELVKAENADRKIGYEAIAKANGKSVEEVSKQAAAINKARQSKK